MSSKDNMGDRMKMYERMSTEDFLIPNLPVCLRLDGRGFSKFTKDMKRPYDERMSKLMIETTQYLVKEFHGLVGYTQSDEISIIFKNEYKSEMIFNGKISKILSVIASACSVFFALKARELFPEKHIGTYTFPQFDCRVYNVPSWIEASNAVLWREQDATKNSISMLAQHHFSHKSLQSKNAKDMLSMLEEKNVIWGDCPSFFKRGTYVKRQQYERAVDHGTVQGVARTMVSPFDIEPLATYSLDERLSILFGECNDL